uniref:Nucleoside diphosphate-linked moiety X motif 17-like n=1 Tax=Phallusia mammillata TaxID=59560 RepID=A0A6F9DMS6_9ASCI|nr:nucleoside diphosphate-linked moiety X motif 17-like [Phallusia mammillata]
MGETDGDELTNTSSSSSVDVMNIPADFVNLKNALQNTSNYQTLSKCSVDDKCKPVALKYNVCYIVAAVVYNEKNEVLLIQEAKASCYQKWYLPAGRVDPDETLVDAVKREVLEESGLLFEPSSLVCVEENGGYWIRFTFTGAIVGGELKTVENADRESLQADWFEDPSSSNLRCKDILPLISRTKICNTQLETKSSIPLLPIHFAQSLLVVQVIFLIEAHDKQYTILQKVDGSSSISYTFPAVCLYQADRSILESIQRLLALILMRSEMYSTEIIGILGLEHTGQSSKGCDGIVFNLAVTLTSNSDTCNGKLPEVNGRQFELFYAPKDLDTYTPDLSTENLEKRCVPLISLGLKGR